MFVTVCFASTVLLRYTTEYYNITIQYTTEILQCTTQIPQQYNRIHEIS